MLLSRSPTRRVAFRPSHERHECHPGASRRPEAARRGACPSHLLLGVRSGHDLQRKVSKFLPPFRATAAGHCYGAATVAAASSNAAAATTSAAPAASTVAASNEPANGADGLG
jgi:hypothetical protein